MHKAQGHFDSHKLVVHWPAEGSISATIKVASPIGDIELRLMHIIQGGYITPAVVFLDQDPLATEPTVRKLYSVTLGDDGAWVGSDGEALLNENGQLVAASAFMAVLKALAQKLRADTAIIAGL